MLFSSVRHRVPTTKNLSVRRTTILQHTLNFFDIPIPESQVWEMLESQQTKLTIAVLARLISKAICASPTPEEDHD